MLKNRLLLSGLLLALIAGCQAGEPTPPDLEPLPARVLFSEILTGLEGNNQADFIELYNAGTETADLKGFSLWYQLHDGADLILLYSWEETTLVPPMGYYALVLDGQQFTVEPDAFFSQALVPNRGGLALRQGEQTADQLAWGSGPAALAEGTPAPSMEVGYSLQRNLDPAAGTEADTGDNLADFSLNPDPALQNSGSPLNHSLGQEFVLAVDFPPVIKPGEEFSAQVLVENNTGFDLQGLVLSLPLPDAISVGQDIGPFSISGDGIGTELELLAAGEDFRAQIPLQADYTFTPIFIPNARVSAENWPLPAFNGPIYSEIGGGPIPVGTARTLIDSEVVVQGISTMYVGGFYAGSGAKFYLEDDTGGIQVYVAGAGASLVVPLGSTVQVRGTIQVYRDSLELVPSSEEQVQIIASPSESQPRKPAPVTIEELSANGSDYIGQLVTAAGRVARVEEFTYSYEIDLFDEVGNLVSIYLDKETGISLEDLEADQFYQVSGIIELLDGNIRLYPRLQSDLSRIYEPGLAVQVHAPTTAAPGEPIEISYLVVNHAPDPDRNLVISAWVDPQLEVLEVQGSGRQQGHTVVWDVNSLGPGEQVSVSYLARISPEVEYISFDDYLVISSAWPEPSTGIPSYTFVGESVPIWAIQGSGNRSPFVLERVATQGVVTGVFPELEGFWIQELESDQDPATSPGLFISAEVDLPALRPGDAVAVSGQVRESYQQTELELTSPANLEILGRGSLPDPVDLDPPLQDQASQAYYESLEGVLVAVPGPAAVVGPTNRYGEFAVVLSDHGVSRSWQDQDHGYLIYVDDGSSVTHEYRDTQAQAVAVGDSVSGLLGPLAFSYGNYLIEPVREFLVQAVPHPVPSLEALSSDQFSLMTWNVENLFDFQVPHPSSPPLPRVSEYKRDLTKIALTIQAAGYPSIIGLQEVEHLGILEDIAAEPVLAGYDYQAVLIEGTDSRGIDVGYLVRGEAVSLLDQVQYPAPGDITSRPPLLVKIGLPGSEVDLYVLNNHFTSMSGGEQATEPRRDAQAAWNLDIAREILAGDPAAYLAIIGDLNSYYGSLPLQTIQAGGFVNVFDFLDPGERYSYVYEGNSQVLDHILLNQPLLDLLEEVRVLHSNADFPLPREADTGILHISDHDPVIAIFRLP